MLSVQKLYTYFTNRYVLKKSTNGWFAFDCPFCVDSAGGRKAAVQFEWGYCKCFKCGFRYRAIDFVMETEGLNYMDAKDLVNGQEKSNIDLELLQSDEIHEMSDVELPYGYVGLLEGQGTIASRAQRYLQGRGFDLELLDSQGFGYCNKHHEDPKEDYFGYIIMPFKRKGKLVYFIGRDFMGGFLRYKNPLTEAFGVGKGDLLFNEDALDLYKRVHITEGMIDAMTLGKSGVSTQGWSLSRLQKSKLMGGYSKELVFVPDKGWYQKAVQTAMEFLDKGKKIYVVNLDYTKGGPDDNKDVNAIGLDATMELIKQTEELTFEHAIQTAMI